MKNVTYNEDGGGILVKGNKYNRRYYGGKSVDALVWYLNTGSYPEGKIRFHDSDYTNKRFENLFDYVDRGIKRKPNPVWDYNKVQQLRQFVSEGLTHAQIAAKMNKSLSSIKNQIYKRGIK